MEIKKILILILSITLLGLFACEKEFVVIENKPDDVVITDTVFTQSTVLDTILNGIRYYSRTTSRTTELIEDAALSQLQTQDLRHRPNGRREHLNIYVWTNNSAGEPSFDARSIIKFKELSLLNDDIIIDSAFITLFVVPATTLPTNGPYGRNNVRIHPVNETWDELSVTWASVPGFDLENYVETDLIMEQDSIREDITGIIQEKVGTNNHGFLFKNSNEDLPLASVRFFSSDYTEINKRPYLTLYYHED